MVDSTAANISVASGCEIVEQTSGVDGRCRMQVTSASRKLWAAICWRKSRTGMEGESRIIRLRTFEMSWGL